MKCKGKPNWNQSEVQVKSNWNANQIQVKCKKCKTSEMQVKHKWNTTSEPQVKCKWNTSETLVKRMWINNEIYVKWSEMIGKVK